MSSNTSNVKLGVCQVFYDGIDLGYTKGGVEVSVSSETHDVVIDQFGKTPINQLVTGRTLKVKVPLAETTIENMIRVMPGATLAQTGGAKATGTWTPLDNPLAAETVVINGTTVTFKAAGAVAIKNEVNIGATLADTLTALAAFLNASTDINIAKCDYSASATVLTVTASEYGVTGNSFTLGAGTAEGAVSGATLTGGVEPTAKRVDVASGIGSDLLASAKELRLHPFGKPDSDRSEDFTVPKAGTGGALSFAYKVDDERIYNVEFTGYVTDAGNIFSLGDPAA